MAAVVNRKPLDKNLRTNLERLVIKARDIAENAAEQSLNRLAVGEAKAPEYLSDAERSLRNRLRAHGRQIGDILSENGQQTTRKLITEVAYEHWHRMLFARFLEQNNLLMYDQHTPVTIDDCNELIQEGVFQDELEAACSNGWELAGVLASKMLPQIFRTDSPVFELQFALELQRDLEKLVMSLEPEVFQAQDSLGWVYQFWQTKRKKEVNESEVKIGADELSPVTQLFTEPYMVSFLLDNALGAWWAGKKLSEVDWKTASSEQELREKASIPGVPLSYLRFVKEEDQWKPASGFFEAWPEHLSELKTLDPCCGSGHFLVAAFLMLVPMRMAREGLSAQAAVDTVLTENLHGLELDQRCVELAVFALALEAWRYPNAGGYRVLPELHLACSGLSLTAAKDEWKALSKKAGKQNLTIAIDWMYDTFKDAPVLGSLINPKRSHASKIAKWEELEQLLDEVLTYDEAMATQGKEQQVTSEEVNVGVIAQGLVKAMKLLSEQYHLVITNVPYLKAGDQEEVLKIYSGLNYPDSKYALETTFLERCHEFLAENGYSAIVTQHNWLFLKFYERLRKKFIYTKGIHFIASLGHGAFDTISGEVVNVCLQLTSNKCSDIVKGVNVANCKDASEKSDNLRYEKIVEVYQIDLINNPDARISFELDNTSGELLSEYSDFGKGSVSGDGYHYLRKFWEFSALAVPQLKWVNGPKHGEFFSGREDVILWGGRHDPSTEQGFAYRGERVLGQRGLAIGKAGNLRFTIYDGPLFDDNVAVLCPLKEEDLSALWTYALSGALSNDVKKLDKKMSITAGTFTKVYVDFEQLRQDAIFLYPKGLPLPFTNDPTQWIFHGHPCGSVVWDEDEKWTVEAENRVDNTVLQVAVGRLLGYQWPAELDPEMELAEEQRSWVEKSKALNKFADDDGIVCLVAVRGEKSADIRLEEILEACYGETWTVNLKNQLLEIGGSRSLSDWLRDKFFEQHCKLFQHRPFIWQIWDGLKDGFNVLVNYHKLDKLGLERLIYTYLGDWIRTQQAGVANGIDGSDIRLAAAQSLKAELEKILEGEKPYDIFVRWKSLEDQPIGWNPDLNDGVRLNIRPFMLAKDMGKKGAGLLRAKPNINWNKDRGKDVSSAPWYSLGLEYGESEGTRINEHHLSLAEKNAVQDEAKNS